MTMSKYIYASQRRSRAKYNKKYYAKSRTWTKRPWTLEEINLVCEHSMTDTELAKMINRSVAAIQVMRSRLKSAS